MPTNHDLNTIVANEYAEFRTYHQNPLNVSVHVLCSLVYTLLVVCMLPCGMQEGAVLLYTVWLSVTFGRVPRRGVHALLVVWTIGLVLFLLTKIVRTATQGMPGLWLLGLALAFYLLPELSHYATGEHAQLDLANLTPTAVVLNVIYLLPFSVMVLVEGLNVKQ